jgi:glycosyltransferase involved in cell wall biosynthesis
VGARTAQGRRHRGPLHESPGVDEPAPDPPGPSSRGAAAPATPALPTGTAIALVHEWLDRRAGSETTFEQIARVFPDADLYALSVDPDARFDFGGRSVTTTLLDTAALRRHRTWTLPVMPLAWSLLRRRRPAYDLAITSSHALVNTARVVRAAGITLCYCHTPARYLWMPEVDGRGARLPRPARAALRRLDAGAAAGVTAFAANSAETAARVRRFYGREATVIPPPVRTSFFTPGPADAAPTAGTDGPFLLAVSRFVPYKRLDLAIGAAAAVGLPLVVAGSGPGEAALRALAADTGVPVGFVTAPSDEELRSLYRSAAALVFPAFEDFGMVSVEAQACGTPVVGLAAGGSLDTVRDGVTGALASEQCVEAVADATRRVLAGAGDPQVASACRRHALGFSGERFGERFAAWVERHARP